MLTQFFSLKKSLPEYFRSQQLYANISRLTGIKIRINEFSPGTSVTYLMIVDALMLPVLC